MKLTDPQVLTIPQRHAANSRHDDSDDAHEPLSASRLINPHAYLPSPAHTGHQLMHQGRKSLLAGSYCSAVLTHTHVADRGAAVLRPLRNARSNREATVMQVRSRPTGLPRQA